MSQSESQLFNLNENNFGFVRAWRERYGLQSLRLGLRRIVSFKKQAVSIIGKSNNKLYTEILYKILFYCIFELV